jgi:hypothetical protein
MKNQINLLIVSVSLLALQAQAQIADAVGQVDESQQRRRVEQLTQLQPGDTAAESYAGEMSDVGPQTVIRYPSRRTWVQASADVLYYHTDNLFLLDNFRQGANVFLTTVEAALAPTDISAGGGELSPRVGYRHQWYSFGAFGGHVDGSTVDLDTFDFNAGTAFADVNWRRDGWTVGGGFDYTRLANTDSGAEFYSEYVTRWDAGYTWRISEKLSAGISYDGDYRWSCPSGTYLLAGREDMDRTDHALTASLSYALCSHAVLQPYYRFKYTDFTGSPDREDLLQTVGLGLFCPLNNWASVRFFCAYETRNVCGSSASDYCKFDIGGGVNVTFRF